MKYLGLVCLLVAMSSLKVFAADTKDGKAEKKTEKKESENPQLAGEVSLDELKKIVDTKSATILDANGEKTYSEGHIPGALSFAKYEGKLAEVLPKDKNAQIVAYCGSTLCTAWEDAAKEAKNLGYTNIKHFKPGIKGWLAANMPTEKVK